MIDEMIENEKKRIKIFIKGVINGLEFYNQEDINHHITDFLKDRKQVINYLERLSKAIDNFEKD